MGNTAASHDAYAADYDDQVRAYDCNIAELLFGMCFAYIQPGWRLLDAGIGTGLSAELFAKAGLTITGLDFSPAMLEICRIKGFANQLIRHDLLMSPWPVERASFDIVVCCGVMHFMADPEVLFAEAREALVESGWFAFTTRAGLDQGTVGSRYQRDVSGGFEIFSHTVSYLDQLLLEHGYLSKKRQRVFVGEDTFYLWVAQNKQ